jgi:hypothetical protein
MKAMLRLTLLILAIVPAAGYGIECSTLEPSICSDHNTTDVDWTCGGDLFQCCKTKTIKYTCPPLHLQEYEATFRWEFNGPAYCGPPALPDGEQACIPYE